MFVYFTVLLSAMQVALATQKLGSNIGFQNFSRVIALISIAFVLWGCCYYAYCMVIPVLFSCDSTVQYLKKIKSQRTGFTGPGAI